jgi:hypothetical protein
MGQSAKKAEGIVDKFGNSIKSNITEPVKEAEKQVKKSTGAMGDSFDKLKGVIAGAFTIYGIIQFVKGLESVAKATDVTGDKWEKVVGGMKNMWNDFLRHLSGAKIDLSKSFEAGKMFAELQDQLGDLKRSLNQIIVEIAGKQTVLLAEIRGRRKILENGMQGELLTQTDINAKINEYIGYQKQISKFKVDDANLELKSFLVQNAAIGLKKQDLEFAIRGITQNKEEYAAAVKLNKQISELETERDVQRTISRNLRNEYAMDAKLNADILQKQINGLSNESNIVEKNAASLRRFGALGEIDNVNQQDLAQTLLGNIELAKQSGFEVGRLYATLAEGENRVAKESEKTTKELEKQYISEIKLKETIASFSKELEGEIKPITIPVDIQMPEGGDYFTNWEKFLGFIETNRPEIQAYISSIGSMAESVGNILDANINKKLENIDRLISTQEKAVDRATALAEKGNVKVLQLEQKRLDELNKQRKKALADQKVISEAEIALQLLVAVATALAEKQEYGIITAAAILAAFGAAYAEVQSLANESTAVYKKGGYTGAGNPNEKAGSVHKGEFVFDAEMTKKNRPIFEQLHKGRADLSDIISKEVLLLNVNSSSKSLEKKLDTLISLTGSQAFNSSIHLDGKVIATTVNQHNQNTEKLKKYLRG